MLVPGYSYESFNFAFINPNCFTVGLRELASEENLSDKVYLEFVCADFDELLAKLDFSWPF